MFCYGKRIATVKKPSDGYKEKGYFSGIQQFLELLEDDSYRLSKPRNMNSSIYKNILLNCWKYEPKERISFERIYDFLQRYECN